MNQDTSSRPPLEWNILKETATPDGSDVSVTIKSAEGERGTMYSISVNKSRPDGSKTGHLPVRCFYEEGVLRTNIQAIVAALIEADEFIATTEAERRAANPRPPRNFPSDGGGGRGGGDRGRNGNGRGGRGGGSSRGAGRGDGFKAKKSARSPDRLTED